MVSDCRPISGSCSAAPPPRPAASPTRRRAARDAGTRAHTVEPHRAEAARRPLDIKNSCPRVANV
ncbi:hypothetical protein C2U63_31450 [Burkholderia pseudomallei]|nr:hypothetical protein BOC43_13265 [Burkholderia pseudomallei]EDO94445.1 hypothetical protein BURPSPAST_V0089 [Burkholderia pseudomallei Pasteur 52237]PPF05366.1 hypothetical protein B9D88_020995 [Burkholderia pseudomallei]RXS72957.1 hypothetical protein C2U63_31450 [Burkholderia pseudomallei]TPA22407.1 hypothetical protein DIJ61_16045 [Burkholderia pseudomallei]